MKLITVDENWKTSEGKYKCPLCYEDFSKFGISTHIKVSHFGIDHMTTGTTGWNKGLIKETDERVKQTGKTLSIKIQKGKKDGTYTPSGCCGTDYLYSEAHITNSAKGGGYREGAGRSKGDYVNDSFGKRTYLQSSYELKCAKILDEMNVNWIRPEKLPYRLGEKKKNYYADFLLVDYD